LNSLKPPKKEWLKETRKPKQQLRELKKEKLLKLNHSRKNWQKQLL
jgi:ribosomal protein L19E